MSPTVRRFIYIYIFFFLSSFLPPIPRRETSLSGSLPINRGGSRKEFCKGISLGAWQARCFSEGQILQTGRRGAARGRSYTEIGRGAIEMKNETGFPRKEISYITGTRSECEVFVSRKVAAFISVTATLPRGYKNVPPFGGRVPCRIETLDEIRCFEGVGGEGRGDGRSSLP